MSATPYARAAYIIDPTASPKTTAPHTMTGDRHTIYSYEAIIAYEDGGSWYVTRHKHSQTTTRHTNAAAEAIERRGYRPTGETVEKYGRIFERYAPLA